jgi:cyclophilin family peptidyl-prolyl cis-trans isomerase
LEPNGGNGTNGTTSKIIKFELYTSQMPITAKNFIDLANQGKYNGVKFHRVIDDFMIQGGDFTNGDGTGGHAAEHHPGLGDPSNQLSWRIPDEFHPTDTHSRGAVSMANAGPNTGGSQFFIMQGADRPDLDTKHAIFGRVTTGMNFVDQIAKLPNDATTMTSVTISNEGGKTYASIAVDF